MKFLFARCHNLAAEARVSPGFGFVVDIVVLVQQAFRLVLRFSPASIIPPQLHVHSCIVWGAGQWARRSPHRNGSEQYQVRPTLCTAPVTRPDSILMSQARAKSGRFCWLHDTIVETV
jgi:hypothetical protein